MMTREPLLALALAIAVACDSSVLHPATGPGTEFPCGTTGQVCPNHMCCAEDEHCGGEPFSGCPEGFCCYDPPSDAMLGKREPKRRRQWRQGAQPTEFEP